MLISAVNKQKAESKVTVMRGTWGSFSQAVDVKHGERDHEDAFDDRKNSCKIASVLKIGEVSRSEKWTPLIPF